MGCVGVEDMEDVKVDPRAKPWCDLGGLCGFCCDLMLLWHFMLALEL